MLIQRIITAAILLPIAIVAILYLPLWSAGLIFAVFMFVGVLEWGKITSLPTAASWSGAMTFAALAFLSQWQDLSLDFSLPLVIVSLVLWLVITLFVIRANLTSRIGFDSSGGAFLKSLICCLVLLLGAYVSALNLLRIDAGLLLLIFAAIWAADIGAYFVGKKFGRHKVAAKISPGKTWQGVFGGLLFSTVTVLIGSHWTILAGKQQIALTGVAVIAVCFSVIGDLFESLLKRNGGFKDSGNILPGHGGVLDRIDGLIAALPIFSVGYLWVSKL